MTLIFVVLIDWLYHENKIDDELVVYLMQVLDTMVPHINSVNKNNTSHVCL